MPELIWETGREFSLVGYYASHSQLLFRSNKGDGGETRIDLIFGPVEFMSVSCLVYREFNLYRITASEARILCGDILPDPGQRKIFGIGGVRISGVVQATSYGTHEDDGEFWEESPILRRI